MIAKTLSASGGGTSSPDLLTGLLACVLFLRRMRQLRQKVPNGFALRALRWVETRFHKLPRVAL